jgi:acyl-CoA thioesterase I
MVIKSICYKSVLCIFIVGCIALSCNRKADIMTAVDPSPLDSTKYSFLALGDSYTIGQGVPQEESWPLQLQKRLLENDIAIDTLTVIAKTGWTTVNLLNKIGEQQPEVHDLVSLLIGVNDQYQSRPFEDFQIGFDTLLQTAIRLAGSKSNVMVLSIPDYGVTPFGQPNSETIAEELDNYNNYMAQECGHLAIPFINITQISRELGSTNNALASDHLHPSGTQYGKWVEEILPIAIGILK